MTRWGEYELLEPLGWGGQADVWRARNERLGRTVALKVLRPSSDDDVVRSRFLREARAMAALRSRHSIRVYDFGATGDGRLYYVMELLDGVDLQSLVDRYGPMEPERVASVLVQACRALDEAHRAGVVHRDVKPANLVVVREDDELDVVKVLDYGLAGSVGCDKAAGLAVGPGLVGTPAYLPPEAVTSECEGECEVDGRADLYSLGCVAYFLLTGRFVFERGDADTMAIAHAVETPEPPSSRSDVDVPFELERLVMACLEKDPANRPATAADLAEALMATGLPDRWTGERAAAWWHRHAPASEPARANRPRPPR